MLKDPSVERVIKRHTLPLKTEINKLQNELSQIKKVVDQLIQEK